MSATEDKAGVYVAENPNASYRDDIQYAKQLFANEDQRQIFLQEVCRLRFGRTSGNTGLMADCDRIWSKEKGYG